MLPLKLLQSPETKLERYGNCRAIQPAIRALHQRRPGMRALIGAVEIDELGKRAVGRNSENGAQAIRAAINGCAVEIAVTRRKQGRSGTAAVARTRERVKTKDQK